MDEMFGFRFTSDYYDESPPVTAMPAVSEYHVLPSPAKAAHHDPIQIFSASSAVSDSASIHMSTGSDEEVFSVTRTKIASHPLYPKLLRAYIDFQKVGVPSDIANLLDKIQREKEIWTRSASSTCLGDDPELDEFMDPRKSGVKVSFPDAWGANKVEIGVGLHLMLMFDLWKSSNEGSSEEEFSAGEIDVQECYSAREDQELKDNLLRKYSGYISSLKHGFSNKKKKGKLPKEARETMLDWWSIHYKWPYPTEADKRALAEWTGLDQKQINNWFINQRKRHWKPSAADLNMMPFGVTDSSTIYGSFDLQ
ncbi:hypothetical protein LguiB_007769 [Lonicera macranthoides]